jgi:hypothetical protein
MVLVWETLPGISGAGGTTASLLHNCEAVKMSYAPWPEAGKQSSKGIFGKVLTLREVWKAKFYV